ncbi:uncharacterized protein LOC108086967 [Drosophila ficusphila]|uniref:uncharacterized protein LOC108086967 n=1 Tax=Drosophila ficusphila TaxID=30025 RepID=UPI0007E70A12|nr:uncharacterized protein LOC108086967 [Drosophila ficusphila]
MPFQKFLKLCSCPNLILRACLLLLIIITLGLNVMEIVHNIRTVELEINKPFLVINLAASFIISIFLALGFYGAVCKRIGLTKLLLFSLIIFCIVKVIFWIVCGNLESQLSENIANSWYQLTTAFAVACAITAAVFYMRLHDDSRQFQHDF